MNNPYVGKPTPYVYKTKSTSYKSQRHRTPLPTYKPKHSHHQMALFAAEATASLSSTIFTNSTSACSFETNSEKFEWHTLSASAQATATFAFTNSTFSHFIASHKVPIKTRSGGWNVPNGVFDLPSIWCLQMGDLRWEVL